MHLRYAALLRKKSAIGLPYEAHIEDLNLQINLLKPEYRGFISKFGIRKLLETIIYHELENLDEANEIIEPPKTFTFNQTIPDVYYLGPHQDLHLKKIKGNAVVLVENEDSTLTCYFIEENKILRKKRQRHLTVEIPFPSYHKQLCALQQTQQHKIVFIHPEDICLQLELIKSIRQAGKLKQLPLHDELTHLNVYFEPKKTCHRCEHSLPIIARISLSLELLAGIPLLGCKFQTIEDEFIPENSHMAQIITTVRAFLFTLFVFCFSFSGPASESLGKFGGVFDHLFNKIKLNLCANKEKKALPSLQCSDRLKKISLQFVMTIFVFNWLFSNIENDINQFNSLSTKAQNYEDSIFPDLLITFCAYLQFICNQLSDPVFYLTTLTFGFNFVNDLFRPKKNLGALTHENEIAEVDPNEQKIESSDTQYHRLRSPRESSSPKESKYVSLKSIWKENPHVLYTNSKPPQDTHFTTAAKKSFKKPG